MSKKTIVQKGDMLQKEAKAASASTIYPGDILIRDSAGAVKEHATAYGPVRPLKVAIEDYLQGNEVSEVYTAGNIVQYVTPKSGDEMLLRLATSQVIAIGDRLVSAGDGTVRKYVAQYDSDIGEDYVDTVIGEALEAVTTTGSIDFILVEIA